MLCIQCFGSQVSRLRCHSHRQTNKLEHLSAKPLAALHLTTRLSYKLCEMSSMVVGEYGNL